MCLLLRLNQLLSVSPTVSDYGPIVQVLLEAFDVSGV